MPQPSSTSFLKNLQSSTPSSQAIKERQFNNLNSALNTGVAAKKDA
jgi:hypothetical protein